MTARGPVGHPLETTSNSWPARSRPDLALAALS
jgi:hypothetical protein